TDFATFKAQIKDAGVKRFGSGWAWLVLADGKLKILSSANQDSPYMTGQSPILGVDVWEHAYYLKYQNKRPDYLDAWWNVVNWKAVGERYGKAKAGQMYEKRFATSGAYILPGFAFAYRSATALQFERK